VESISIGLFNEREERQKIDEKGEKDTRSEGEVEEWVVEVNAGQFG
jgi:hypothetical protein